MGEEIEYVSKDMIDGIQGVADALCGVFAEINQVGGSYVTPSNRLMLLALAQMLEAKDILETGYNTGLTTLALALSGAQVTGVDNQFEQPGVERIAEGRLAHFPNVRLVQEDALLFLVGCPPESYDLIFIDDCHWPDYTKHECVEIQRVLRPGGCAVFHDTFYAELWEVIQDTFPPSWQRMNLPSRQQWEGYSGIETMAGRDLGLGIVRKPWKHIPAPRTLADCLQEEVTSDGRKRPAMHVEFKDDAHPEVESVVYLDAQNDRVVGVYAQLLREKIPSVSIDPALRQGMEHMMRSWGQYASACAGFVGHLRYHDVPPPKKQRKKRGAS